MYYVFTYNPQPFLGRNSYNGLKPLSLKYPDFSSHPRAAIIAFVSETNTYGINVTHVLAYENSFARRR